MLGEIISTQSGWTPLMMASLKGHVDVAKTLIEAKASVNTKEKVYIYTD